MLEVSVTPAGNHLRFPLPRRKWEWQVTSGGQMLANGFEKGPIEARLEGYNAMFQLLAAGWNP
jgi:hypothetical protein